MQSNRIGVVVEIEVVAIQSSRSSGMIADLQPATLVPTPVIAAELPRVGTAIAAAKVRKAAIVKEDAASSGKASASPTASSHSRNATSTFSLSLSFTSSPDPTAHPKSNGEASSPGPA